jgi:hypothetical protein
LKYLRACALSALSQSVINDAVFLPSAPKVEAMLPASMPAYRCRMPNYHRAVVPGRCSFFTVNLWDRRNALSLSSGRPKAGPGGSLRPTR